VRDQLEALAVDSDVDVAEAAWANE